MILTNVNLPGILILSSALAISSAEYRCGISALQPSDRTSFALGIALQSKKIDATTSRLFTTQHFAFWYRLGNDPDSIQAPWNAPSTGDTLPIMVRSVADDMERAWRLYVDTLGMRAPQGASSGRVIGGATPTGLYPVEICRPEHALTSDKWVDQYFGLAMPASDNPEHSTVLLSSRIVSNGWTYPMDTGGYANADYHNGNDWLQAMRASAVHELFHACQFRYERSLGHFLFEASAVAMEDRGLPQVHDHLYYLASLYGHLEGVKSPTVGLMTAETSQAYRHGLYVMGLMQEKGQMILPALWSDRANRVAGDPYGSTILGTMRTTLASSNYSWRESLIRYGMRILVSGRHRNWTNQWNANPAFPVWDNAAIAPVSAMLKTPYTTKDAWMNWSLDGGDLKFVSDPLVAGDLQVNWVADDGAFLVRLDSTSTGFVRKEFAPGTYVIPAAERKSSLWIVGSDGTSKLATNPDRSVGVQAHLSFSAPPAPVPVENGTPFRYVFPIATRPDATRSGGQVLSGTALMTDSVGLSLDSGVFVPSGTLDPDGALLATGGTTWVLADTRKSLHLRGAELSFPGHKEPYAFVESGGLWTQMATRMVGDTLKISWGELSLSKPVHFILTAKSTVPPRIGKVFPNPSLGDAPVTFQIYGNTTGLRLTMLAADGSLVRQWSDGDLGPKMQWDLRNNRGNQVRPGVYTWILNGKGLQERGRILVGR